jgi:hypothetical protein
VKPSTTKLVYHFSEVITLGRTLKKRKRGHPGLL